MVLNPVQPRKNPGPTHTLKASDIPPITPPAALIGGNASPVTPSTVLVVDDSAAHRELVRRSLEEGPEFRITAEAANGVEAVARAQEWQPDIILLDLKMPVVGGLEALPKLVVASPGSLVMVMSDSDKAKVEATVLERGAVGFIPKDVEPSQLPAAIAEVLHGADAPVTVSRPRILVVGYDSSTRGAVADGLAYELNAVVVGAVDGEDGLQRLRAERFDLIVCGNRMEGMDGPGFLEQSTALAYGTPCMMFAQPTDPSIEEKALEAGATLFVPRATAAPERSIQDLAQKIRRLLFAFSLSGDRGR